MAAVFILRRLSCSTLDNKPKFNTQSWSKFDRFKSNKFYDKKVIWAGDSITVQGRFRDYISSIFKGLITGAEVSYTGIGGTGNKPTAVGGSTLIPFVTGSTGMTAGQSLFQRSKDFVHYNPEIIIIYMGANDIRYYGAV